MSERRVWNRTTRQYDPAPGWEGDTSTELFDMTGRPVRVGVWLAYPVHDGNLVNMQVQTVREIRDGKVYLGSNRNSVKYPGRCLIVDREITELPSQD